MLKLVMSQQFFFLHQHRVQRHYGCSNSAPQKQQQQKNKKNNTKTTTTNNNNNNKKQKPCSVPFGQTCFQMSKCSVRVMAFPTLQKHLHRMFPCDDVLQLLSGEVFPVKFPELVMLLWGPVSIAICSSQLVQKFHFVRTTFENSDRYGHPLTITTEQTMAQVKCLMKR